MAHFFGEIHGKAKTPATRLGDEKSGIEAHIRGWKCGVHITGETRGADSNRDVFHVCMTNGSVNKNGEGGNIVAWLGDISVDANGLPHFMPNFSPKEFPA